MLPMALRAKDVSRTHLQIICSLGQPFKSLLRYRKKPGRRTEVALQPAQAPGNILGRSQVM